MKFKELCEKLEGKIQNAYEEGVTLETAERLASEFLYAQLLVSGELKKADLDSRMRKTGVKAIRASIYLEIIKAADKKPTEAQIAALIDTDNIVEGEQKAYDIAEVEHADLKRYYDIFTNAHIFFRGVSRGVFGG